MSDFFNAIPETWKHMVAIGAVIGTFLYGYMGGFRNDPYTGTEGRALSKRVDKLESRQPATYPPPEWQTWRTQVMADINAIRNEDRHQQSDIDKLSSNCENHTVESEQWKRRIERNEQWIEYLNEKLGR